MSCSRTTRGCTQLDGQLSNLTLIVWLQGVTSLLNVRGFRLNNCSIHVFTSVRSESLLLAMHDAINFTGLFAGDSDTACTRME